MFYQNDYFELRIIRTKRLSYINYCYFVVDKETRKTLIIDPAWEMETFEELIEKNGTGLSLVLLTHSHYDHTNLANDLYLKYHPKIYMSSDEMVRYGYRGLGISGVEDNQILKLGNRKITCLLTLGHTEGSMCFKLDDCFFTGDTIFIEGCGVCDLVGSNPEQMFDSLQMLKRTIRPNVKVFPGHAFGKQPGVTFSEICRDNIYLNINDKQKFVEFRMRPQQGKVKFI